MNRIKTAASATKKFVVDHKTTIAVVFTAVATAATVLKFNQTVVQEHNNFLKEKGLYDEYYFAEDIAA